MAEKRGVLGESPSGFSVLEVLVAAAIMTACLVPVVAFSQRGLTESGITQEEMLARQILIDLCERFKSVEPGEIAKYEANPGLLDTDQYLQPLKKPDQTSPGAREIVGGLDFRRSVSVVNDFEGVAGVHRVKLEVTWTSRRRKPMTISISRLIHFHKEWKRPSI